jgi:DNA-binding MarR family transcriptional regulator
MSILATVSAATANGQTLTVNDIVVHTTACVSARAQKLARIITRSYDRALRPHGITVSQFTLLIHVAKDDGITASRIGKGLDIEKSTLSRNLKRLLDLDHIVMDPPAGRRGRGLHLTHKGIDVLMGAYPAWSDVQRTTLKIMGVEALLLLDVLLDSSGRLRS